MKHKRTFTSIPLPVLMYFAWRNLVSKKLRAFLTLFGIVIGIGAIFFLLSFGIGLQDLVTNQVVGNQSVKTVTITSPNSKVVPISEESYKTIKGYPHIKRVGSSYSLAGIITIQNSRIDTIAYGVDADYLKMQNPTVIEGRLLRPNDDKSVVVNESIIKTMNIASSKAAINKEIQLSVPTDSSEKSTKTIRDSFKIIGVIEGKEGNELYIPAGIVAAKGVTEYSQLLAEVDEPASVNDLRLKVRTLGLETTSAIDTVDQIGEVFKFFDIILVAFGAIGMVVAVLGMFNTLTISLLERTREIGLMVALGGRNRDMKKLFIFEAVLLSVLGAIIGMIGATIFGQLINLIININARSRGVTEGFQLFAVPWWLVVGSLVFMIVVGLIVVYIPARRASRINPIDALRRD